MVFDLTTVITAVITLIGGGLAGYFTFRNNSSNNFREDFKELVDKLQADVTKLEAREAGYVQKIRALENEVGLLKNKLVLVQAAQLDLPIPQNIKDTKGTILAINAPFEETFLVPKDLSAADVIGKRDIDFFPADDVKEYLKHDKYVLRNRIAWQGIERIDFGTHAEDWEIMVYPVFSGNLTIGTARIAFKKSSQPSELEEVENYN